MNMFRFNSSFFWFLCNEPTVLLILTWKKRENYNYAGIDILHFHSLSSFPLSKHLIPPFWCFCALCFMLQWLKNVDVNIKQMCLGGWIIYNWLTVTWQQKQTTSKLPSQEISLYPDGCKSATSSPVWLQLLIEKLIIWVY